MKSFFKVFSAFFFVSNVMAASSVIFVPGAHLPARSFNPLLKEIEGSAAVELFTNAENISLKDYALRVCQSIKGKAVLAGHSQGGAVINEAFGLCPQKIKALIYIAATIPFPGEKPFQLFEARDDEYYFKAIKENKESGLFEIFNLDLFLEGFAPDASPSQKASIKKMARHEPIAPSADKVSFNIKEFQKLPKLIIETEEDRIISVETQRFYSGRLENSQIVTLSSGHLPMLTAVKSVAKEINLFRFAL